MAAQMSSKTSHLRTRASGAHSLATIWACVWASVYDRRPKGVVERDNCMVFAFLQAKQKRSLKRRSALIKMAGSAI